MFKNYNISVGNYTLKLKYNGGERLCILRAELWLEDLELNDCGWPTYIITPISELEAKVIADKVSEGLRIKPPHQVMQEIGLLRIEDCRPPNTILFIKER
jgi:hypothetical protein